MIEVEERLIQVTAPFFCAGLVAKAGRVILAAPILAYMTGWNGQQVNAYCKKRGWTWSVVTG